MAEQDSAEQVSMIMRQTNYDTATAEQKLSEHNNDVTAVIRSYLNPGKVNKPCTTRLSVNQQIYKEIRCMMDDAAKTYLEKKEPSSSK